MDTGGWISASDEAGNIWRIGRNNSSIAYCALRELSSSRANVIVKAFGAKSKT